MAPKALVIDDDPDIREDVGEILDSMGHEYDMAGCQEEGRELLAANEYSYFLLDLEIPIGPGRKARIQNGENMLREIVARRNGRVAPVLIITGHGTGNPHLAVEMMKLGASDYITKPFATVGRTLDRAILEALDRSNGKGSAGGAASESQVAQGQTVKFEGGELVFYRDRVELCGVTVVEGDVRMRKILEQLRERRANGKYVAYSGAKLAGKLQILAGQNAIAEAVKDFRDEVVHALKSRGIVCGRKDVIHSGGCGYRLADWITARDAE
jgi:DNA-binding response OmpR family regulator